MTTTEAFDIAIDIPALYNRKAEETQPLLL